MSTNPEHLEEGCNIQLYNVSLSFSSSLSFSLSSNLQRRAAGRQEEEGGSTPTKPQQPGKHNQAENHGGISTSPKTWSKEKLAL